MIAHDFFACDAYAMRYDNTPNDSAPGEKFTTKWAVTALTWATALQHGIVSKTFEEATADDCQLVRHVMFWNALHCGQLPPGINYLVYSAGLLAGPGYIARAVQKIVGAVQDGVIGKDTLIGVNRYGDKLLMNAIWAANAQHFKDVNKPQFLHGWLKRNDEDIAEAYQMASVQGAPPHSDGPAPVGGFPDVPNPDDSADALMSAEQKQLDQGTQT